MEGTLGTGSGGLSPTFGGLIGAPCGPGCAAGWGFIPVRACGLKADSSSVGCGGAVGSAGRFVGNRAEDGSVAPGDPNIRVKSPTSFGVLGWMSSAPGLSSPVEDLKMAVNSLGGVGDIPEMLSGGSAGPGPGLSTTGA